MTPLGKALPWIITRHFLVDQLASSGSIEVSGIRLQATRTHDWFFVINIPSRARGLRWLWLALQLVVPAGLVIRYNRGKSFEVTTTEVETTEPKKFAACQIDNQHALVSYLGKAEVKERKRLQIIQTLGWRAEREAVERKKAEEKAAYKVTQAKARREQQDRAREAATLVAAQGPKSR